MAMESPAWANQNGSYSAEQSRRAVFAAFARAANSPGILAGGLLSTTDMQLSAPGSGMSVNVSTGEAIVPGTEGGSQGGYYVRNVSQTNLVISTANATNPRIDTVCCTIADSGYTEPSGVSGDAAVLKVVTGTPTSGATLTNLSGKATLPASSLLLGYALVPAGATNIITADLANKSAVVGLQAGVIGLARNIAPVSFDDGFVTITWPGATAYSNTVNVTHALGRTPSSVFMTPVYMSASPFVCTTYNNGAVTSTQIQVAGYTPGVSPAASVNCGVYWCVFG